MQVSALNLKRQISPIRAELDSAIKEVVDSTSFILGRHVEILEKHIAEYCSSKYAIGVSNGTDALSLSLMALGIKSGDGVICPTFTYYATAGAIAAIGARPVFCDIDRDTYNISIEDIKNKLLKKNRLKIKAIIPVHLYGQCADMGNILKLAGKHKIKVIEDAAQSFGAEYLPAGRQVKGKKSGTLGDCGTTSFYPGKNLGAFGDAGAILTNNRTLNERLKILRNQGNKDKYFHLFLGRNNRLDSLQAAVLDVKLKYLDAWNKKRSKIAQHYNKKLAGLGIKTPVMKSYSTHIYHQYVIRVPVSNKGLLEHLNRKGIDARVFYPLPLHLQKCFKYLGYKRGDFPQAEAAARQTIALPIDPELNSVELNYIVESIKEYMHG